MKQCIAKVISNTPCCENMYEMQFLIADSQIAPRPGQFCTIRVSQGTSPLLRRPFAISNFDAQSMITSMVYKKCGPASEILAGKNQGDPLDVIIPLGNSFIDFNPGKKTILVAGGTGFGPLFYLNKFLMQRASSPLLVLGCRSKNQIPLKTLPGMENARHCTEDGSEGFRGDVVDYLRTLQSDILDKSALFCCGPTPMLKACHEFALEKSLECYVSLEQVMACGVGACMGCVVKIKGENPYARVCTEGPVFNSKMVAWT
jgi:dihydroorotate dehydrogenase electron transfer subunit